MSEKIKMTKEGLANLKAELEDLKVTKRDEIAEKIRVARSYGDLSENSEYDEAKNEQAIVEARIAVLEEQVKNVEVIDESMLSSDVVAIGTTVTLLDVEYNEEMVYKIVTTVEGKNATDTLTVDSPVGEAILNKSAGDEVIVNAPIGEIKYKILNISVK